MTHECPFKDCNFRADSRLRMSIHFALKHREALEDIDLAIRKQGRVGAPQRKLIPCPVVGCKVTPIEGRGLSMHMVSSHFPVYRATIDLLRSEGVGSRYQKTCADYIRGIKLLEQAN